MKDEPIKLVFFKKVEEESLNSRRIYGKHYK
jgi:hypothetical protein